MPNGFAAQQAQAAASMEATRLHRQLGTSFDGPIDVLSIARELGLVLMLQPLESLLGFYVRGDEISGIVLSSLVPESLQRFTLAHEIGHHVLGHEGTADDEHTLGFDQTSLVELTAQAFAASLLMPLPLLNRALRELPATRQSRRIEPADAYLFSRQLGVSYTAGVWALYRRGLLSLDTARAFIKQGSLAAKDVVRGGERVSDARADVWRLTAENNDLSVMCRVGDEIHVELPEDTSRGVAWLVRSPSGNGLFDPVSDRQVLWSDGDLQFEDPPLSSRRREEAPEGQSIEIVEDQHVTATPDGDPSADTGSQPNLFSTHEENPADRLTARGGIRSLTFVPREEGDSRVILELARPWETDGPVLDRYELDLRVRPKRLGGQGLFAPAAEAWVDDHVVSI